MWHFWRLGTESDAAQLTYYGLHALQHRGQEGAGIVLIVQAICGRKEDLAY
jgi:glutamine phosphoribosylpyrophosphate amidotransferase